MNRIEPTGMVRIEWYLARLTKAVLSALGGDLKDWQEFLIKYQEPEKEQTPEESLAQWEAFEKLWRR